MNKQKNLIVIGRIKKPFGVHGYIKVDIYSGEYDHLNKIKYIYLSDKIYYVEDWLINNPLRFKLVDINTPEVATQLTGAEITIERKYATPLKNDEYYLADLENLTVIYTENNTSVSKLGIVAGIITDSYAPLLEIIWNNSKKTYVPFIKEFFAEPNIKAASIEILRKDLIEE